MHPPATSIVGFAILAAAGAMGQTVSDTSFAPDRGYYPGPVSVTISSDTPGALISYTTDGSEPQPSGGAAAPVVVELSRSAPLRALAYVANGSLDPTDVDTHTYVIETSPMRWNGSSYTTSSAYPAAVVESLKSLPALFIAMDPSDFATVRDSGSGGIGQSGANEQYERPCSAELWYPPNPRFDGFEGFQIDAGLRPHSWVTTKRAFRLYFKREYGAGKLRYPVFESAPWNAESAAGEFDKLVLRHHSNDGWEGRWGGAPEALYLRDQFARACQIDMGGLGSRSMWAHLFVNGAYYGLYSPCERPDDDFLAAYLGGDDDDYLGFNHGGVINDGADTTIYNAYRDPPELGGGAAYEAFKAVLDPAQFSDYLVSSWFNTTHSHDWPVNGTRPQNFYGGNRNTPPAGTQHFTWDFEAALVWDSEVHDKFKSTSTDKTKEFIETWFALIENEQFIEQFADRAYRHLFNGGALAEAQARRRLDAMAAHVQPALEAEKWQWGGGFDNWNTQIGLARGKLVTNPASLVASLRSENYYPPIDPPLVRLAGDDVATDRLRVAAGSLLTLINSNGAAGEVRYTVDGTDPRDGGGLGGGDSHSVTIDAPALLKARVKDGATWSALRELSVIVPQDFSGLRISEVMYNPSDEPAGTLAITQVLGDADLGRARVDLAAAPPADLRAGDYVKITGGLEANRGTYEIADVENNRLFLRSTLTDDGAASAQLFYDGDRFEFIEVENGGLGELHLGAVEFSKGVQFAFPAGFSLGAGERAVIANRPWDFADRYPGVAVAGEFLRDLDNGGEKLELAQTDAQRHEVLSLSTNASGFGEIVFSSLPAGAVAGNRVRVTGCELVTNNGSYLIQSALGGTTLLVSRPFVDAPGGALAQLFEVIDAVEYDDKGAWPRAADGVGYSLVRDGAAWRASAVAGGSPGASDPAPPVHPVLLVNEALTHTDLPQVDAIEIHNPGGAVAPVGGWWLSDDLDEPDKWQIPAGSMAAGGFLVFDESDFGTEFRLGSDGDDVYLFSPDLRYSHGFDFGAAENGVSFGRHLTSSGEEHFVRQSALTLDGANAGPRVGPAVISEIFYHPPDGGFEFLEVTNISASPLDVTGWGVGGFGFEFPPGTTLAPGEVVLVLEDEAAAPGAPAGTRTFLTGGKLSNGGERLRLRKLDGAGNWITIDEVDYDDRAPWPTTPDGDGFSLERIANGAYGNDPANWRASGAPGGTPGASDPPTTPLIAFEPAQLEVATLEGTDAGAAAFEVWNVGIGSLSYSIADGASWISGAPSGGSSANATDRVAHTVTFDTGGLAPGIYNGSIVISSGAADNSPTSLPVTLTVRERDVTPPVLVTAEATGVSTVSLTFSEPVLGGADQPGNYSLDHGGSVLAAVLSPDGTRVELTTSPLLTETLYTVAVTGVSDRADIPNPVAAGANASFFYAGSSLPEGLVAHWRFDDGSGSTAADEGGANNLSLQQSPAWVAGNDGGAIDLNGDNQYATRGDAQLVGAFPSKSSGGANEFTMAAWIYLGRLGHRHPIMTKQGNGTRGLLWSVESDNRLSLELFKNQSDDTDTKASTALSANRWYHVAVSYAFAGDGSSRVRLYVDGALEGSSDSAVGPPAANGVDFNIGRYWWSSGYSTYFDGRIDDFVVFDRELGLAEIGQVYSGATPTAAEPQIAPAGGEFVSPVTVAITTPTAGAEIYYTLDGSEPTGASALYTSPLLVKESTTVRARAFAAGHVPSDAATATFTRVESSGDWSNTALPYRLPVVVSSGSHGRRDLHCAVVDIDLGAAVADSLRVVEIDALGAVIDPAVGFQYDADDGELVLVLHGVTPAGTSRRYQVYYATEGNFSPPVVSPLVVVDPDSSDGGFDSIRFVTPAGTWHYHKVGAGFSSLDDIDGNDWIGWSTASGSGGAYRGIPNMAFNSGYFHPGGEGNPSTTTLSTQGPVRSTLTSVSGDGEWEVRWDIYPAYAQMDVVRRDPGESYWFLYEGTPGGSLSTTDDFTVRPDGTRLPVGTPWTGDLPGEEWVYVEDSALDRAIYIVQHQPDDNTDSYWQLNGDMTVLGFGRLNLNTYLSASPNVFTVGLADGASFANMESVIESAYRPLASSVGAAESIPATAAYEAWARDRFGDIAVDNPALEAPLWGALSDPEGDGLINALEHVAGLDPGVSDSELATAVVEAPGGGLLFRYRLAEGELGWRIDPQFSFDLDGWDNLPGTPVRRADFGGASVWELPLPDVEEAVFARLRVSG